MKFALPKLFDFSQLIDIDQKQQLMPVNTKSNSGEMEIKSYGAWGMPYSNMYASFGWYELLAYQSLIYFRNCSPVFNAVSKIADKVADIRPYVYNKKTRKFLDYHPVLDLLNHPFGDMTYSEFIKELVVNYIVTGNNYTAITGNIKREPLEMMNIHPGEVIIMPDPRDGYNGVYNVNRYPSSYSFVRQEENKYWRYRTPDDQRELWQMRTYNCRDQYNTGYYGMSTLMPILYEIEQHLHSSRHNLSLLTRGARLSLVLKTLQPLPQEEVQSIRSQITAAYQSSANAGNVMIINGGFEVEEMGMNNKDMDFLQLKKEVTYQIYNTLEVPLPLISPDHSTMNNLEKATLMLYDNAVLPMTKRAFQELTLFLMPRYKDFKDNENLIIAYKEEEITALEPRRMENLKFKKELNQYTVNEMRSFTGDKPLYGEGGNSVYRPATELPVASSDKSFEEEEPLVNELTQNRVKYINFDKKQAS